jgi:hypothetical protein
VSRAQTSASFPSLTEPDRASSRSPTLIARTGGRSDDELARARAEADRARFDLRRGQYTAESTARSMGKRLEAFEGVIEAVKHAIEEELRAEHFGHDPDRPVAWRADGTRGSARAAP